MSFRIGLSWITGSNVLVITVSRHTVIGSQFHIISASQFRRHDMTSVFLENYF